MDLLEPLMAQGHKVLVFSQFVEMLDLLKDSIESRGWSTYYLVGGTEKRGDLVRQFQNHDGAAVFLQQTHAFLAAREREFHARRFDREGLLEGRQSP